jgi:hypothetical protein
MFGWGVEVEERYMDVLENKLQKNHPEHNWEVLVFAVPGYNALMEWEVLKTYALAYEPDLVIHSYTGNDNCLPNFVAPDRSSFSFESFINLYFEAVLQSRNVQQLLGTYENIAAYKICERKHAPDSYKHLVFDPFLGTIQKMADVGKQSNIPFFSLIALADAHGKNLPKFFSDIQVENDQVGVFNFSENVLDYLKNSNYTHYLKSDLALSRKDGHPSAKSHFIKGNLMYSELAKSGVLEEFSQK